ncbi:hypothetical protein MSAN_01509100 [Mycena sanguinolenta]|uniref:Uncharacterized protein n=1 Tax=Mycena sanguinolenta TaxID=230812 RepID=A0A8H7CWL4_9AGAR|nr:hypothetical protein MSAN_01509100 [Mycena sanguinolenta]
MVNVLTLSAHSDHDAHLARSLVLPHRFRLRIRIRVEVGWQRPACGHGLVDGVNANASANEPNTIALQLRPGPFRLPNDLHTHRDDGGIRHPQGTTPVPPTTAAAALVDENANRARTSYPTSLNNPVNSSLASAASLAATSPNPHSTTANLLSDNQAREQQQPITMTN